MDKGTLGGLHSKTERMTDFSGSHGFVVTN
jgi:hypothetical protein